VKHAAAALIGLALVSGLMGISVVSSAVATFGADAGGPPVTRTAAGISLEMPTLYQAAAMTCPGLPWTVLAAIGTVESDNGESTLPGVHSGVSSAGAEGPMQFLPPTFSRDERHAFRSHPAMCSATMMIGRLGVPVGTIGMIEASATVSPAMPWTDP
jgi:hypothetical protein